MVRQDWIRHTDLRPLRYHNRGWRPCRRTLKLLQHCICLCLIFICIIPIFRWSYNRLTVIPVMDLMSKWTPIRLPSEIRIAKATIAYDPMNQIYDGALALHDQHNKRYGYEMHILRTPLVKGFANKMLWLQQTIIAELQRNVAERAEWILYFDPTALLSDPSVPLHTFFPHPSGLQTHKAFSLIASKPDGKTIDSTIFFIRVSTLSLRILTLAMAAVYNEPNRDWGADVTAGALQHILEREEHRERVVYQSSVWYGLGGSAQKRGGTFVEAQKGVPHVKQLLYMQKAFGYISTTQKNTRDSTSLTVLPSAEDFEAFWALVREVRIVLTEAKNRGHTVEEGEFKQEVRALKDWFELRTWDVEQVGIKMEGLKKRLGLGNLQGVQAVHA